MVLPQSAYIPFAPDMRICRLLNGMWQVSGGHGAIDPHQAVADMLTYHDAGFVSWDLADHYGPAEDFIGIFRREILATRGDVALEQMQAFTKWVPRPGRMTRLVVEAAVNHSLRRMHVQRLDLLQFHWWDYENPAYLDALKYLSDLQQEGKIKYLALTNFDTEHMQIIIENGIRIVSNQVQYSLVDRRPEVKMAAFCQQYGIGLLTYGTFCGGLLSEKYLDCQEPDSSGLNTASLRKYKNMIDAWGGWSLFQQLLHALKAIADKHHVSIANVATRSILDQPAVAGVIVGVRLGVSEHRHDNVRVFDFMLDNQDLDVIQTATAQSQDLFTMIGDCGSEYRR